MVMLPKWQTPPVHPVAEKLPMMSDAEIKELAADIKANGLLDPIVVWEDNREAANGATGPFPLWLLDGRNRMAALELLGIKDPEQAPRGPKTDSRTRHIYAMQEYSDFSLGGGAGKSGWKVAVDPTVYVLSANVRRRHLTSEQKRQAIKAYIAADPKASDRAVGHTLGVSHHTVAEIRSGRNGQNAQTDHLPRERAKTALRADPALTKRGLMAAADVSSDVAVKVRKELEASGEIAPKEHTPPQRPKPKPRTKSKRNPKGAAPQAAAPTNLAIRKLRKELIAFSEDQIGKLADIGDASAADIADYIAAVDQVASKLKALANRIAEGADKEVKSK